MSVETRAREIVAQLTELTPASAIRVLVAAVDVVVSELDSSSDRVDGGAEAADLLTRRSRGGCGIARDPAMVAFIAGTKTYMTLDDLRSALIKKFGKKKVPSRSSLHRYLQKVAPSGVTRKPTNNAPLSASQGGMS